MNWWDGWHWVQEQRSQVWHRRKAVRSVEDQTHCGETFIGVALARDVNKLKNPRVCATCDDTDQHPLA